MAGDMASGSEQGGDNVPVESEWQCCGFFKTCWASTGSSFSGCLDCSDTVSSSQESIPQEGTCALFCHDLFASIGYMNFTAFVSPYLLRETSNQTEPSAQGEEPIEIGGPLIKIDPEDLERMIAKADYHETDEATHCVICNSGNAESLYGHRCNGEGKDISLASIVCQPCSGPIKNKCPSCRKTYGNNEDVTASKGSVE
jgi:hypothetical protein